MRLPTPDRAPGLFALAAGAAAALAHPPFGVLPGLFGWALLFALWDRADGPKPLRRAFFLGWLAAVAYFLIGCWWVAEAFLVDAEHQAWMAPIAVTLLPAGLGLFWGAAAVLYRRLRPAAPWARVLLFAAAVSLFEWLRGHLLTGFPWNLPGETWRAGSAPSQAAAVFGAYGLTWVTLFAAAALAAPLWLGRRRQAWALAGAGAFAVAALYGYGAARLGRTPTPDPAAPWVRVVQADVKQEAKYDADNFRDIVERYVRLTALPGARRPDIVVWPEGALPAAANEVLAPGSWTLDAIASALRPGQTLMMGAYRVGPGPEGPLYYNSLLALRRDRDRLTLTGLYDKHRLVPFGEYLPAEPLLSALGVKDLAHIGDGFTAGPPPRPISPEGVPSVQPLICYESLYPGFARAGMRQGERPRWIVNISNDAWFGRTSGPRQHLNQASYRAIEEGLPVVRSTPTGVSAVIDAHGRVDPRLKADLGQSRVVDAPLPPALAPPPFATFGPAIFWGLLALSFALAPVSAINGRIIPFSVSK